MVVMDGQEGQLGIVKGHHHVSGIEAWSCSYDSRRGRGGIFTNGGFAEVQPENITILVDSAVRADDLDELKF